MNRTCSVVRSILTMLALACSFASCADPQELGITESLLRLPVFIGKIEGGARDSLTGAGINAATMRLTRAETRESISVATDQNGSYVFWNLAAGAYKLEAIPPAGYAPSRREAAIELRPTPNSNGSGISVVAISRDFVFSRLNRNASDEK